MGARCCVGDRAGTGLDLDSWTPRPLNGVKATSSDHASIIRSGRERVRAKLTYTNVAYALVPPTFTIADLRVVYDACLGHTISATNLQRVLLRRMIIEVTELVAPSSSAGGRPATLYRFSERSLRVTDPFAVFRPPS